jgi:hypothetical protein
MMYKMRVIFAIVLAILFWGVHVAAKDSPRIITEDEARELAKVVARHNSAHPMGPFSVYRDKSPFPCCYLFEARSDASGIVAGDALGSPLVSKQTSDVWDYVGDERYDFPELRKLQAEIRKKRGITRTRDQELEKALGVCTVK